MLALAVDVRAAGPTVAFTLPPTDTTPATFGSLPYPNDLYFDGGQPGDGDGTLLNAGLPTGAKIGLAGSVLGANPQAVEDALDQLDGFGTTTAIYFFLDGALDPASLPASPVLSPSRSDAVFCADTATLTPVPIAIKFDVDTRIPNVLAVTPLAGRPLSPDTRYTCVVRTSVTGGGDPVEPSADWVSVRDGASANSDADAIFDPVVTALDNVGVAASTIAGMTVFTTQTTTEDMVRIRDVVLPGLAVPTVDFTSRRELVFETDTKLALLIDSLPHDHVAKIATGFFPSPSFQTSDPDGDGPLADTPIPPSFVSCATPCETTDESFVRDGSGNPIVQSTPSIPVTVVVPKGTPPINGWPVIIVQHGLGGQRDVVVKFAETFAAHGFASVAIDAAAHGYRFFNCTTAAVCSQDTANEFGALGVPDGFVDGTFAGYDIPSISFDLGFMQALHNFAGVRDNIRQTQADLLSLVRLLHGHSIDSGLSTQLNDNRIFFIGHELGGLIGTGFVALEPSIKGAVLSAPGAYLTTQLFNNSASGLGEIALANGVLGLDPGNASDQFSIPFNLVQQIADAADGANFARLLLQPVDGSPRNVIMVEGIGDERIPNQSTEALALAAGLQLFDPFVQDLPTQPLAMPVVVTPHFVRANAPGGATAALLQVAAAHDAQVTDPVPNPLQLVPGFAHWDEFEATGNALPMLDRGVPVGTTGLLQSVLDWFGDIAASGPPGTFSYGATPNYSPIQNVTLPAGDSSQHFFSRTIGLGGAIPSAEPTPHVSLDFDFNSLSTRLTVARTNLGSTPIATDGDVPPGPRSTVGTLGYLPFFVSVQRELPGVFAANLTISYTADELGIAAIAPGSAEEQALQVARFEPGVCFFSGAVCSENAECGSQGPCFGTSYTLLPTIVDTNLHTATTNGLTGFSTFVVLHPNVLNPDGFIPATIAGGPGAITDCRAEWELVNPNNFPFRDRHGRVNGLQNCRDGDPSCDDDRKADGTCTFRLGICFNYPDSFLPLCVVDPILSYQLTKPKPLSRDVLTTTNAHNLLDALVKIGGFVTGVQQNVVFFNSPLSQPVCTDLVHFKVKVKGTKAGSQKVRALSRFQSGDLDVGGDRLRLRCFPAS